MTRRRSCPLSSRHNSRAGRLPSIGCTNTANLPIESARPASPFRRLMITQDTRLAIVGPAPISTGVLAMLPWLDFLAILRLVGR
jgi:hypothetical protein